MIKIRVEYVLSKKIDDVFAAISDHENYSRYPGFTGSELLEPGTAEKNGEGALRLLSAGRTSFRERITRFERPHRMDYRVEEMKPFNLPHERGEITLKSQGDSTRVVWISDSRLNIPIVGSLLERLIERRGSAVFLGILKYIERH